MCELCATDSSTTFSALLGLLLFPSSVWPTESVSLLLEHARIINAAVGPVWGPEPALMRWKHKKLVWNRGPAPNSSGSSWMEKDYNEKEGQSLCPVPWGGPVSGTASRPPEELCSDGWPGWSSQGRRCICCGSLPAAPCSPPPRPLRWEPRTDAGRPTCTGTAEHDEDSPVAVWYYEIRYMFFLLYLIYFCMCGLIK